MTEFCDAIKTFLSARVFLAEVAAGAADKPEDLQPEEDVRAGTTGDAQDDQDYDHNFGLEDDHMELDDAKVQGIHTSLSGPSTRRTSSLGQRAVLQSWRRGGFQASSSCWRATRRKRMSGVV